MPESYKNKQKTQKVWRLACGYKTVTVNNNVVKKDACWLIMDEFVCQQFFVI